MGKRRRIKFEDDGQKSFLFVFTTDYSSFSLPRMRVSLPKLEFLKGEDEDEEAA